MEKTILKAPYGSLRRLHWFIIQQQNIRKWIVVLVESVHLYV